MGFWANMGVRAIFGVTKGTSWRKASKCKKLLKQLRQSLAIQKNRRNATMRQLHADIAQFIQNGQHKAALARVPQLHKDAHKLLVYDHIEKFSHCVEKNLNDISSHSKLSIDVCEALSSLIFAASRCGELPELHSLRNLFKGLLGEKFDRASVELLPGNTVNSQIKNSLDVKSVGEDVKIQLINDITREYKLRSRQPIQVQPRALSRDADNGIKDQNGAKNFDKMFLDIGPKDAVQDRDDFVVHFEKIKKEFFQENSNEVLPDMGPKCASRGCDDSLVRPVKIKNKFTEENSNEVLPDIGPKYALPRCDDSVVCPEKIKEKFIEENSKEVLPDIGPKCALRGCDDSVVCPEKIMKKFTEENSKEVLPDTGPMHALRGRDDFVVRPEKIKKKFTEENSKEVLPDIGPKYDLRDCDGFVIHFKKLKKEL